MRYSSLFCLLAVLAGCPGGDGAVGERCGDSSDCESALQCVENVCVPHCQRAPECGDGYACDQNGLCRRAIGQEGDDCTSEVDCAPGLACELTGGAAVDGVLPASCTAEWPGRPAGATCSYDMDCRDYLCALGHCVDLCRDTRDCAAGTSCTAMPRIEAGGTMFQGCLQAAGTLRWTIPIAAPQRTVLLPSPASARELAVTMQVSELDQEVGAVALTSPSGIVDIDPNAIDPYTNPTRHFPAPGQSVLVIASSPTAPLEAGAYSLTVSSLRPGGGLGTAIPRVTAVAKLDSSVLLDLHFYFLNFDDHPCSGSFGDRFDATMAETAPFFQDDFLGSLRGLLNHAGIQVASLSYEDLRDHPELDGLDVQDAASLLALGAHDTGINVFFVRTLRPVGLQAFGPGPGPAGLAGTSQSGVIVGLDTLCYRSWGQVARLTAHELARYMGLYENVEIDYDVHPSHVDPIPDSDTSSSNLMFYSELGGIELSDGQRNVLARSPVLR